MDLSNKLALSYYKTIAVINQPHNIYLVQHQETGRIYIKKILNIYNIDVYNYLCAYQIPGTPQIIECYEEDDRLYLIEEYISGTPLQDLISDRSLTSSDAISYMLDLCHILDVLHSMNPPVIHRDIKPSNIIITSYNKAVLLDFNAAKQYSDKSEDTTLLGTQGYAAPEQYGFGASSPQTDVYSLGVVFKEMLDASRDITPALPAPALEAVAGKCTRMSPSERYTSVRDIEKDLLKQSSLPAHKHKLHPDAIFSYLPPGFRTHNPLKMLIATLVYLFIFWIELTFTRDGNTDLFIMWLERIVMLFITLTCIFVDCNYQGWMRCIPLSNHPNSLVRLVAIIIANFVFVFSALLILFTIETIFFPVA